MPLPSASASDDDGIVLSSYHVSTNVNSRLATTSIDMVFENNEDCATAYSMTIQLPVNARVTELVMDLSDGCQLGSEVKDLDQAEEDFEKFLEGGKAAAILTAYDMSSYNLEVSIPPNGATNVTLEFQELLVQKLDLVSFQIPMFPGRAVVDLKVDVSVEDPNEVNDFRTDFEGAMIGLSMDGGKAGMHYEEREVKENTILPTLLRANFQPGLPPEEGLFLSDGECFTHIFNPALLLSTLGSMARKIVFVIDVSGSMSGDKLKDVKKSFGIMVQSLDEQDSFVLQTFSTKGTEQLWGPEIATIQNKNNARVFVNNLETIGGTNLNDAYLDGIANALDAPETVASVVVIMTDGQGSLGADEIVRNVREKNEQGKVKIFSLAFGEYADYNLLLGISIMNGGRAVRIYEGFGDATDQMELFYKQELGSIIMSDVKVAYDLGDVDILDSTTSSFPIFAAGSEIVVRGKLDSSTAVGATSRSFTNITSFLSAKSAKGSMLELPFNPLVSPDSSVSRDCRQSFSQARIVELLEYRDAAQYIGNEFSVGTAVNRTDNLDAWLSFEEEAREIALDAGLVWPGLTALVTVENSNCQQKNSTVCYTGDGDEASFDDFYRNSQSDSYGGSESYGYSGVSQNYGNGYFWLYQFSSISFVLVASSSLMLLWF